MLQQLEIRNVAVIADMTVELGEGLNVISGETGSGKSVLIESLKGVFGGRFTKELVRGGADKAVVSALFSVGADTVTAEVVRGLGFEPEGGAVLLSREINQAGKGVCRVNGRVATVGALQAISSSMADIHGQNENHSLSDTGKHIVLLDRFAGDALGLALSEYRMAYASYRAKAAELGRLTAEEEAMRTRAEALRVQVAELSKARLREGEEEELRVRREAARNASEIAASLGECYALLNGVARGGRNLSETLKAAAGLLGKAAPYVAGCSALAERLGELGYSVEDLADQVRKERDSFDYPPDRQEETESRIDAISRLKRRYGGDVASLIRLLGSSRLELEALESRGEDAAGLRKEMDGLTRSMREAAGVMHGMRAEAAERLEGLINPALADLDMKDACFKVVIDSDGDDACFGPSGLDAVGFMVSANKGEGLKPLAKVASGGEISRIMLAIKGILADLDEVRVLVFDEIDTGISGKAAAKAGIKLSRLACGRQVICVTHLAQIAVYADTHILLEKGVVEGRAVSGAVTLDDGGRLREISRITGGSVVTEATLTHAGEMLAEASRIRRGG